MHSQRMASIELSIIGCIDYLAYADAYSAQTFFFFFFLSPKLSYVRFVLARDHLGKLEMEK